MKLFFHGGSCGDACCLRVQDLSVKIGNEHILQDLNLHVHCGELVALIGPNGAGKSTFLKAVLGQQDYEGVIAFSSPGERNRRPRIGYVPQSPTFDPGDPVAQLDVSILQNNLLGPVLGIEDPRVDKRIDFVGGIRGLEELEKRCREDMKVAFAVYPVDIEDLIGVADADMVMPPKSTWFEPKLGSGLFMHQL